MFLEQKSTQTGRDPWDLRSLCCRKVRPKLQSKKNTAPWLIFTGCVYLSHNRFLSFFCTLTSACMFRFCLSNLFLLEPQQVRTQCQDEVRILSGRTQKLKVANWCWKQLNEHNLMYIYHKQCENMQKIQ